MVEYSEAFRERMVQRLTTGGISASELSKEVGVSQPTLSRWLRDARIVAAVAKKKPKAAKAAKTKGTAPARPRLASRSPEDKVRIVREAAELRDEELGAFLRREGLHEEDLAAFREEVWSAAVAGLSGPKKPRGGSEEDKRIKELERELRRKEAALAEAAALLVLRKKAAALWGEEGEDT
ncbi:MAG: winged helix-turn-helix transcriptional regulator [Polyangiaceae bacterium]|nr:winged helix-turn-helix transcriptional regulator [Polyangiaceae bacterium]